VTVYAYGRHWHSAEAVVEAERRVREGQCVCCGQHLDGRLIRAWADSILKAAALEAKVAALEAEVAWLRAGGAS
jgi:hypothetical protein